MDLRQLEYVVKIAQALSFTKAAKELFVSQSSLSQSIKNLENEIGVVLFERSKKGIGLTSAGESFVDTAIGILEATGQLAARMSDQAELKSGHIRIGIPFFRGSLLLPRILPIFMSLYPGVKISIEEGSATFLEESILEGKIDFCLVNLPISSDQISYRMLKSEQILLITSIERSLLVKVLEVGTKNGAFPLTSLAFFKDDPFILIKPNQRLRNISDGIFIKAGFKPNVKLECRDLRTIHHLVAAGVGSAITIESSLASLSGESRVASFSIKEFPDSWPLVAAYHKSHILSKASEELIRITEQVLNE